MIGKRLAHYQIHSHLGTGGMGEVYQAIDSKLGRSVAIKLLPEAFTHDHERAARFEREARVLALLNHQNIAAIYGVEESGGRKFLVMELVDGETLAEKIKRGAIPVPEALGISIQITDALEAAHEKGIIHRDLKPANIKVTPEGRVKVLDFGLAKAFAEDKETTDSSNSPTAISAMATNAGMILGTAAYMSPEQARGRVIGKRSDIFGFGCVLFEMLTGRPAFEGEDFADILSRVLQSEPDWKLLPSAVPVRIRELLQLCMQKDMRKRRSDAADVRIDIEQALAAPVAPSAVSMQTSRRAWVAFVLALIVAIAFAVPAWRHLREITPPLMSLDVVTPATDDALSFAVSPDGRQLVFVASGDGTSRLWLRTLNSTNAQPLAGTEGGGNPFWSPDGRSIGFFANAQLKRLDLGSTPQTLTAAIARGGTWNKDDVILFTQTATSGLYRIPASGGEPIAVTRLKGQNNHRFPTFLPDGHQFLFYAQGSAESSGIYLGSLDGLDAKRLTPSETAGYFLPSGWLIWGRSGSLIAQRLDVSQGTLTGEAVMLADGLADDGLNRTPVSIAANGLIVYRVGGATRRQLIWFDRTGKNLGVLGDSDVSGLSCPSLAPDGRRAAVFRTVQGNTDIWILDGSRMTRFTYDPSLDRYPLWSPDGNRIAFDSNRNGHRDIYQKFASGGTEIPLVASDEDKNANDWSVDGKFLMYYSGNPQTDRDIWVQPLDGNQKAWPFLKTKFNERLGKFSPDGRWVAYMSNESGRMEIYIRPFVEPHSSGKTGDAVVQEDSQWQVSTNGGIFPRWSYSGKEIHYIGPKGEMMSVSVTYREKTIEPGPPVVLFQTRIVGGGTDNGQGLQYDVTRDGRFLINTALGDSAAVPITVLLNWQPTAK